jgi:hypothetical protein
VRSGYTAWRDRVLTPVTTVQLFPGSGPVLVRPVEEAVRERVGASLESWIAGTLSGRQEEAAGQQIELGAAKHLAFQHLQPIDVPFDRALAPGQRDRRLDSRDVRPEPSGETPEGRKATGGGARQPRLEFGRLTLADEAREVPRERHRLR